MRLGQAMIRGTVVACFPAALLLVATMMMVPAADGPAQPEVASGDEEIDAAEAQAAAAARVERAARMRKAREKKGKGAKAVQTQAARAAAAVAATAKAPRLDDGRSSPPPAAGDESELRHDGPETRGAVPEKSYAEGRRGSLPYSELSDSALSHDVSEIATAILKKGGDEDSRVADLMCGVCKHQEIGRIMAENDMPTPAHLAIALGIRARLHQLQASFAHLTNMGRLVSGALMEAAVSMIGPAGSTPAAVADALGVHPRTVTRAKVRQLKTATLRGHTLLDPSRAKRCDALPSATAQRVQEFWEAETRASPDMQPVATLVLDSTLDVDDPGYCVQHGIHWQEKSTRDLYALMLEKDGRLCGRETFRLLRPYFVRKPKWRGCLCPTCHVQRLNQEAMRGLVEEAVKDENVCACRWCTFHRGRAQQQPPCLPAASTTKLMAELCCSKMNSTVDSGFTSDTMPCFSRNCFKQHLVGKQQKFIEEKFPDDHQQCEECVDKYVLYPDASCTFIVDQEIEHKQYRKVPRFTGVGDREELQLIKAPALEFIETFRAHCSDYLLHRYVCDWQDAYSEELIKRERPNHMTIGWDFAMNYTCVPADEMKQEFFQRQSISIHTTLGYCEWPPHYHSHCSWKKEEDQPAARPAKMLQSHMYFSNDPHHDPTFVRDNNYHLLNTYHKQRTDWKMDPLDSVTYLSDGGPGHYKQKENFYNMSCICSTAELCPGGTTSLGFYVDYVFLGPNHGKSNWDGLTGIKKNQLRNGELNRQNSQVALPLSTAPRCTEFLNSRNKVKDPPMTTADPETGRPITLTGPNGLPKVLPFEPNTGSSYAVEVAGHHLTEQSDLETQRDGNPQVSITGKGTRSHFHYRFTRQKGQMFQRWLACPCARCVERDWDGCVNKALIGGWVERTIMATGGSGVAQHLQVRRNCSSRCTREIESLGQTVAMITTTDVTDRRKYWLGTVTKLPYKCAAATLCPSSGEQFSKGEEVLHVVYFDNIGLATSHDRTYHKSDAREYIVRCATLRCVEGLALEPMEDGRASRTALPRYTLPNETHEKIMHVIDELCHDE